MDSVFIDIIHQEQIDYSKLYILDEDKDYFWYHHGNTPEDKKNLAGLALLSSALQEQVRMGCLTEEKMTPEQKYAVDIFWGNMAPELFYNNIIDKITVDDGRHRLAVCKELNLNIKMTVKYPLEFELYKEENKRTKIEVLDTVRKSFTKNNGLSLPEESPYTYFSVEINKETKDFLKEIPEKDVLIGKYGREFFYVIPYKKESLDDLINKYRKDNQDIPVYTTREKIHFEEEIK